MEIDDITQEVEEEILERIVKISKDEAQKYSESLINALRRHLLVLDSDPESHLS